MSEFPTEAIGSLVGHIGYLERKLHRAELMHKRTAEHLREERNRRRKAELSARNNEEAVRSFLGCEDWASIDVTPRHYQGDTWITCRRALESCQRQPRVVSPTRMDFYWWANAFKYVWRMWSKEDPRRDAMKAIDCLKKAAGIGRPVRGEECCERDYKLGERVVER